MEIYYFGTNGEKVGPVTKEALFRLIESGVVVASTRLIVNGKNYTAGQIPTIAQLINRQKAIPKGPQAPPMPRNRQTSNSHGEASKPNSFAKKIGHLYEAASNQGYAPKLESFNILGESLKNSSIFAGKTKLDNDDSSSNPVYVEFWSKFQFVIGLLRFALVVLSIIFALGIIRGFGGFDGPVIYGHLSKVDEGMYTMVTCSIGLIITFVSYHFLVLFCLFMASVVRSADDARISRSLQEDLVQK